MSRKPRRRKTDRMRRGKRPEVYMARRGCWRSMFGLVALAWLVLLTHLGAGCKCDDLPPFGPEG